VYSGFRNDIRIEAVAEVYGVDVVAMREFMLAESREQPNAPVKSTIGSMNRVLYEVRPSQQ